MAWEQGPHGGTTKIASVDLSASQYRFVKLDDADAHNVELPTLRGDAFGVVQNKPAAGEAATIFTTGTVKVIAGEAIDPGVNITTDATGRALEADTAADVILGVSELGAASAGLVISVRLRLGAAVIPTP